MRKTTLFQIFSVVMLASLVLSACGSAAATPTAAPMATEAPVATQAPAATEAPTAIPAGDQSADAVDMIDLKGKNVQVTFWHSRPQGDQDFLQGMLDEFNKSNPYGITATAEIGGAHYNELYNKVNAAIQAGQPPSMSLAYQNQAAFYRGQNAVVDLTPFINSKTYGLSEEDKKDIIPAFLASDANPQFKGEILGFPTQRSMEVLYYNVDWLNKLGYTEAPKDWKTFEEAACKASQESGKSGWAFRHDASNFASQVFSRGGQILASDGSAYVFNSQAGIDTLSFIQRMFANKCAVEIPPSEAYGEQNRFANGDVLFVLASSSGLPYYGSAVTKAANFKWDIAMVPQDTATPAVNLYGASISVYKTTPEQELASWLVIKFLAEKEQTARWASRTGYFPVRVSAESEVIANFKADPKWGPVADSYAKMFDWVQYSKVESPVAGYDPVRALVDSDLYANVINDPKADVKSLLDAAVAKANDILKQNAPK